MLNSGEVPNLFPSDEYEQIISQVRPKAKEYGIAEGDRLKFKSKDNNAVIFGRKKNLEVYRNIKGKKGATCEARTHDLQIMRLTRCRLRQGGS